MKENLLRNLVEKISGKQSVEVINLLLKKEGVSENILSKRTKMPVNEIRNILYKLSSEGIVFFNKKKDKRKGWFIYFWSLNQEKALLKIESEIIKEIEELKASLEKRKKGRNYFCPICKNEIDEETGLEQEFVCQECNSPYSLVNNDKIIEELNKNIQRKEKNLIEVRKEIEILESKNKRKTKKKKQTKRSIRKKK